MRLPRLLAIGVFATLMLVFLPPFGAAHAAPSHQAPPQGPQPCGNGGQPPHVFAAAPAFPGAPGNPNVGPAEGYGGQSYGRWGCDSIWVDSQQYGNGQPIFACYTVRGPDFISIELNVPGYGWENIAAYQDDGTGGCFFLGNATGFFQGWRVLQLTDYGGFGPYGANPTVVQTYYYVP